MTGVERSSVCDAIIPKMAWLALPMRDRGRIVRECAPNRCALTELGVDVFRLILEQNGFSR